MEGMLHYFIPEDGDSSDHYNIYPIPNAHPLRLVDIQKSFPLPGTFQFRFKMQFESTYVWLDVSDEHAVVPTFEGLVFAKVSRISSPENSKLDTPVVDENTNSSNSSVLFEQEKSAPDLLNTDDFEGFDTSATPVRDPFLNDYKPPVSPVSNSFNHHYSPKQSPKNAATFDNLQWHGM